MVFTASQSVCGYQRSSLVIHCVLFAEDEAQCTTYWPLAQRYRQPNVLIGIFCSFDSINFPRSRDHTTLSNKRRQQLKNTHRQANMTEKIRRRKNCECLLLAQTTTCTKHRCLTLSLSVQNRIFDLGGNCRSMVFCEVRTW